MTRGWFHVLSITLVVLLGQAFSQTNGPATSTNLCFTTGYTRWLSANKNCYFISRPYGVSWNRARERCKRMAFKRNAGLVTLSNDAELKYLQDQIRSLNFTKAKPNKFWIGIYHGQDVQSLISVAGRPPLNIATLQGSWSSEFNNLKNSENCVVINAQARFADEDCGQKFGLICQKSGLNNATSPQDFSSQASNLGGWRYISSVEKWYLISDVLDSTQWFNKTEATTTCNGMNSELLKITNQNEMDVVQRIISWKTRGAKPYWTQMKRSATQPGVFQWADNSPVSNTVLNITKTVTEPDFVNKDEHCIVMNMDGKLEDKNCNELYRYICVTEDRSAQITPLQNVIGCDDGWYRGGRKCYLINNGKSLSWDDSSKQCKSLNANLAKFETMDELDYISMISNDMIRDIYYIGLQTSDVKGGVWKWADDSVANMTFIRWFHASRDLTGSEDCMRVDYNNIWSSGNCHYGNNYVCETRNTFGNGSCPLKWKAFGQACYLFGPKSRNVEDKVTWYEARDICRQAAAPLSGNLVSMTTKAELDFVRKEMKKINPSSFFSTWIGMHDTKEEAAWRYDSQEPVNWKLVNWGVYPRTSSSGRSCVYLYRGGYALNGPCGAEIGYICEKPATGITQGTNDGNIIGTVVARVLPLLASALVWSIMIMYNSCIQ